MTLRNYFWNPVLLILIVALITFVNFESFAEEEDFISVDKQVQIVADVTNSQEKIQPFAYLVQIQDENDATISLAWLTGSLSPKQMLSPALSWIPENPGTYTVTIFVWESIDNPEALSPPLILQLEVR
jgi:hypothetical protein